MTLDEIERQLDYFNTTCNAHFPRFHAYDAAKHRHEGLRGRLCDGKEPARADLIWLKDRQIWQPISAQDREDLVSEINALEDGINAQNKVANHLKINAVYKVIERHDAMTTVQERWLAIMNSEPAPVQGNRSDRLVALERRVARLEAKLEAAS